MSRHDDGVALRQMAEHLTEAVEIAKERSRKDLNKEWTIVKVDFPLLADQIEVVLRRMGTQS